jgi:hypothetical protein
MLPDAITPADETAATRNDRPGGTHCFRPAVSARCQGQGSASFVVIVVGVLAVLALVPFLVVVFPL